MASSIEAKKKENDSTMVEIKYFKKIKDKEGKEVEVLDRVDNLTVAALQRKKESLQSAITEIDEIIDKVKWQTLTP